MKVEVVVLGPPSLISLIFSVDVKLHCTRTGSRMTLRCHYTALYNDITLAAVNYNVKAAPAVVISIAVP